MEKDELVLQSGGKSYTLSLDVNALCEIEALFDKDGHDASFMELIPQLTRNFRGLRKLAWLTLHAHHPELTEQDAGRIVQDNGGLSAFPKHLKQLMRSMVPDERDLQELGSDVTSTNGSHPHKAQAGKRRGIGASSISTPVQ
jgi:hypothetical protein